MNYKETLQWLFNKLPMYQRMGKAAYKADLGNTVELLDLLGNPQNRFKVVHVAGTNGKGSVSNIVASVLQDAGLKTGLYTSPHLKDFRERIRINGELIPEEEVVNFVQSNMTEFDRIKPSFFEMTVGMAFDHFAKENVDIAVIEVGLGGRLDSTNIVNPLVSVITNIGFDHTQFLGNSIEQIAIEKAGIIKEGVPVVIGRKQAETSPIFEKTASEKRTELTYAENHYDIKLLQTLKPNEQYIDIWKNNELFLEEVNSPLLGFYQQENIATALMVLEVLTTKYNLPVEPGNIREGIEYLHKNTGFIGRWHVLDTNPLTICDTGHNEEGIKAVVQQLMSSTFDHLHFIFGMVNDKDPETILSLLPRNATYYFCKPDIPRGMDAEELQTKAAEMGLTGLSYSSVDRAFSSAFNNARPRDLVFVGGSTYVVAEVI
ncbi:MAG: bifunctional folylpolyglutamate synthase/dihydrofolate synthase [Bacteroidetes bacterium]|nr:MAG: bifunctional folylpolyglutamate synthase/dihydrofolate synthase [Bacteroidota bacterium]